MRAVIFSVLVGCTAITSMAGAPRVDVPEIEIKGIKIGMPLKDASELIGTYSDNKNFTIGGVETNDGRPPTASYKDEKLSTFLFMFKPDQFGAIMSAVSSKYPVIKCANSKVQNGAGAKFDQVDCKLTSKDATLTIRRYVGDVTTGVLYLSSLEAMEKFSQEAKKKASDI